MPGQGIMMAGLNGVLDQSPELSHGNPAAPKQISHLRACTNCVRAKSKCSFGDDNKGRCERCHRMNKDCTPSPPMRKRRVMKRPPVMETSKLEQKLDGIVTLLKSATQGAPVVVNSSTINTPLELEALRRDGVGDTAAAIDLSHHEHIYARQIPSVHDPGHFLTPIASSSSSSESTLVNFQSSLLHPSLQPSPEDAELCFNKFRTDFAKHVPFIVISPSVTSNQLRQERPILWACIMAVTSSNSTQQIALSKEVRAIFGREALVERTKNLDLLLGILVYAIWDLRHSMDRPIFVTLLQIAIAMLYELGLDKPASNDPGLILTNDMKGFRQPSKPPTMDERRAWFGCFLMSSRSSALSQKGDTLRWTAYSNESLRVIETQSEVASDILLVQQAKLRLIAERVMDAPWSSAMIQVGDSTNPPAMFHLRSLETQLHAFKSRIPSELADNKTLLMELHDTSLRIHEIALSHTPDIFSADSNQRLKSLYACLNAASSWVLIFLTIPPAQYVGLPTTAFAQIVHLFVSIYRLATFEDPSWDRRLLQETIDVSMFLETTERNLLLVKEVAGLDRNGSDHVDIFSVFAARVRVFKMWWAATNVDAAAGTLEGEEMVDVNMEFLDDEWLRDLIGPWNE